MINHDFHTRKVGSFFLRICYSELNRVKKRKESATRGLFCSGKEGNPMPSHQYMTLANESFAHITPMTCSQSSSPIASVNASIARPNDALTLATHLPCFHEDRGVTKVTRTPTSFESITPPHNPPRDKFFAYPCTETPANESSATPRTGCPNHSAGSNLLDNKSVSSSARVASSLGPETMS